jgi:amidohydrolase
MPLDRDLVSALDAAVDAHAPKLDALARELHAHPELRFEEHRAAAAITALLEAEGHAVERGLAEMPTSFRARAGSGAPRVAILAEYDALPEIGHACGHNLIAAGAVGAFLAAAAVVARVGGTVELLGTPAEEGGGGKIKLIDAGAFAGVDAAIMYHPFDRDLLVHPTLASTWIRFTFQGTPSHAAIAPHEGKSALTACMDTFRLIDGQRVHFRDGVRVHGYILDGGQAVNVIPESASCEISVRAETSRELDRVKAVVLRCARAAAMASDVPMEIDERRGYAELVNNRTLAQVFGAHLERVGRSPRLVDPTIGAGSTDMGDVSHVVPAIHPWVAICDEGQTTCHQRAFAEAAASERGLCSARDAGKSLAATALEFLASAELRAAVKAEFDRAPRRG